MTYGKFATATAAALMATAGAASAAHLSYYRADLMPLNDSGITGTAFLQFEKADAGGGTLSVDVQAQGQTEGLNRLVDGMHPMHIHGFPDTDPMDGDFSVQDSVPPVPANGFDPNVADDVSDGDGFTELTEGVPFYGAILQTFEGLSATDGIIDYQMSFDIAAGSDLDDAIYSLDTRETVLHGLFTNYAVEGNLGFPGGDVDINTLLDEPVYNALLPIATAAFVATDSDYNVGPVPAPVPLPAGIFLMGAALGSLGVARKLKKRA